MTMVSFLQRNNASQEELDSKVSDLKKELGYWESYLGSNKYIAGSQFSLAGTVYMLGKSISLTMTVYKCQAIVHQFRYHDTHCFVWRRDPEDHATC